MRTHAAWVPPSAVACERATGDILVEFDHDDELASTCLERVADAFEDHPEVGFVYSDCAQINEDESRNDGFFDLSYGWQYSEAIVDGRSVLRCHSMAPSPHNVSYIWYAPNHVRAFRRSVYDAVGGYDPARTILDDQDLMCRMYEAAPFLHIPECLYLQRVHAENTQSQLITNRRIQRDTVELYDTYVQRLALAWARREGLHCLDLGAAHNKPEGYLGVDQYAGDGRRHRRRRHQGDRPSRQQRRGDPGGRLPRARPRQDRPLQRAAPVAGPRWDAVVAHAEHRRPRRVPGPDARRVLQREQLLVLHRRQLRQLRARDHLPGSRSVAW